MILDCCLICTAFLLDNLWQYSRVIMTTNLKQKERLTNHRAEAPVIVTLLMVAIAVSPYRRGIC